MPQHLANDQSSTGDGEEEKVACAEPMADADGKLLEEGLQRGLLLLTNGGPEGSEDRSSGYSSFCHMLCPSLATSILA